MGDNFLPISFSTAVILSGAHPQSEVLRRKGSVIDMDQVTVDPTSTYALATSKGQ
jgi:hypothetical protein